MNLSKAQQKDFAKQLFLQGISQKEIASRTQVSERTISKWVNDGEWHKLRVSTMSTREELLNFYYKQLSAMKDTCEKDNRLLTNAEVDSIAKITKSIQQLECEVSLGETIQVFVGFLPFVQEIDFELYKKILPIIDSYINNLIKK